MSSARVLFSLAFAASAMAAVMGLMPISTHETGSFRGSVDCGSAWMTNSDGLTGTGEAACAEGGLNVNRTLSFALIAGAIVLFLAASGSPPTSAAPSPATPAPEPPPTTVPTPPDPPTTT